jgi:hypothetical protein
VVRKAASGGSVAKEAKGVFSPSLIWFRRLLVVAVVVAGVTASAAGASAVRAGAAPDVVERYVAVHPYGSAVVPDVVERYVAVHSYGSAVVPDVVERYVAAHPYGAGSSMVLGTDRIVDDWFRDPTPAVTPAGDRIVDDSFRDPTRIVTPAGDRIVDDSFRDTPIVVGASRSGNGLDWEDFGIGAGAMLGLTLLLAGLGLGTLAMRHRAGKLGTS